MKKRCKNENAENYYLYGGRGIKVCEEWLDKDTGFIMFRDWSIQNGYNESLQIDRIDNNGNYEPNNCRWVTITEQNRNQRRVKLTIEKANEIRELYKTKLYSQRYLAKNFDVTQASINSILKYKIYKN